MLEGYEKTQLVQHLKSWAHESDQANAHVVPGMHEMAYAFADLIEAQNEVLEDSKRKGAALVNFSDKWMAFVNTIKTVEKYIWPVRTAVAEVREFGKDKK